MFLGPMLILFCPKMSAVRTRLNRTGCVKNKHCRCEIKGRSMEVSSWNSFSDLRLLTSIILTTDLNSNSYSYYLDSILLLFIYAKKNLQLYNPASKVSFSLIANVFPQDVERRSSLTPKGPPENIYYCD